MLCFKSSIPHLVEQAQRLVRQLQQSGYEAYFAGGCVRDTLRGKSFSDMDIATSATPDEVAALFPSQSIGVGKSFGVMLVVLNGISYDVATFRTDGGYQDGRHPQTIAFSSAEHDAQRRDFTINALFYDPIAERLLDFVGGEADLRAGIIRAIGDPLCRFREDRLRMLRAIRFAYTCDFVIEPTTWHALCHEAHTLGVVSIERIRNEFLRTLCISAHPDCALEALFNSQLLSVFFPELCALRGCLQDPQWHPEGDVWAHTLRMLTLSPAPRDPMLVWAILLHDIGKPAALIVSTKPDGSPWYRTPGHAEIGARMAASILRRFKECNDVVDSVVTAVRYHMQFVELPKMKPSTARKMLGRATMPIELELHRVDCLSSHAKLDFYDLACAQLESFAHEPILPKPLITGEYLISMGMSPGKALGKMLKDLYTAQLDGANHQALQLLAQEAIQALHSAKYVTPEAN